MSGFWAGPGGAWLALVGVVMAGASGVGLVVLVVWLVAA